MLNWMSVLPRIFQSDDQLALLPLLPRLRDLPFIVLETLISRDMNLPILVLIVHIAERSG